MFSIKVHTSSHLQANQVFAVNMMKGSMFSRSITSFRYRKEGMKSFQRRNSELKKRGKTLNLKLNQNLSKSMFIKLVGRWKKHCFYGPAY